MVLHDHRPRDSDPSVDSSTRREESEASARTSARISARTTNAGGFWQELDDLIPDDQGELGLVIDIAPDGAIEMSKAYGTTSAN